MPSRKLASQRRAAAKRELDVVVAAEWQQAAN
jgi:hypothetical protein